MTDFRGADAKGKGAERTVGAGMTITANDGLTWLCRTKLGTDDVHDAAVWAAHGEQLDAKLRAVLLELRHLLSRAFEFDGNAAEQLVGVGGRRVVHGRQGAIGTTHRQTALAQHGVGLGARHFMRQVQVDVQNRRCVDGLRDHLVCTPDLFKQSGGVHVRTFTVDASADSCAWVRRPSVRLDWIRFTHSMNA